MEIKKSVFMVAMVTTVSLMVVGCAKKVTPPYNVTLMDDHVYEVSVPETINNNNSKHRYLLYRAAQQAQKQGCEYFFAINNNEQKLTTSNQQEMDENFIQEHGVTYYISSGTYYRIIFPKLGTHIFACTAKKPTGILPGLVYRASYTVQNPPLFETPGIHFKL
ncbi:Uncharacterised protein [Yersinia similis]|uniref:Lipoprotein n=1 Tax=Yersinia similis TaxID=367190 RepID=A0A0T9RUD4_9GAMM|nr:hypothetical protein [Yersinia similis]CNI86067.1 Uncharacterised protein [Yersinia similis]